MSMLDLAKKKWKGGRECVNKSRCRKFVVITKNIVHVLNLHDHNMTLSLFQIKSFFFWGFSMFLLTGLRLYGMTLKNVLKRKIFFLYFLSNLNHI